MGESFLSDGDLSFGDLSGLALPLDIDCLLSGVELDVGLRRKVRTDSTVGSVGSSASLGSSINLDVINDEVLQILGVGVGLKVVNESEDGSDGLFGPSTKGLAEFSSLSGSADASVVLGEGDASAVGEDVLEVLFGFGDGQALDGFGGLVGIFIMDAEVSAGTLGN